MSFMVIRAYMGKTIYKYYFAIYKTSLKVFCSDLEINSVFMSTQSDFHLHSFTKVATVTTCTPAVNIQVTINGKIRVI